MLPPGGGHHVGKRQEGHERPRECCLWAGRRAPSRAAPRGHPSLAGELAFALNALYVPAVGAVLGTGPVDPAMVATAALGAPALFCVDLARKRLFRGR